MIKHIARLSISAGLVVGSLVACASAPDAPGAEGAVQQTTQALRNCPDGPCEPVEPKPKPAPTHTAPTPPPPVPTGPTAPAPTLMAPPIDPPADPPGPPDFHCGGDKRIKPDTNPPQCWEVRGGGPGPGGLLYATRYLCPALGTYPYCNAYGDCWCLH